MKLKIISICIIVAVLLCSCVEEKKYIASSKNSYIKCYVGDIPSDFAPTHKMNFSEYNGIFSYLFDGLVSIDKGGNVKSALSDEWSISDDGLEYQFHIRKNAKWSDGEAITSEDFVRLFKYILAPGSKNNGIRNLFDIYGAKDYHVGKTSFNEVAIKAKDAETLKIRLNRTCSDFIKILAGTDFLLRDGSYELDNLSQNFSTIKFSGAFKIKNRIKEGIVLDKNRYYWDKSNVENNTFLFMGKISCEEALAKFEAGDIDMLLNPPVSEIKRFMNDGSLIENSQNIISLSFNVNKKSGNVLNKDIRMKIIQNLNLENIKEKALADYKPDNYEVFKRIYSPNMQQVLASTTSTGNVQYDGNSIRLLCANDGISKRIAQQVCNQLRQKLNLKAYLTLCDYSDMEKQIREDNFQILIYKYIADYDRQLGIFKNLLSNSYDNYIGYKNAKFDSLMEKAFYLGTADKLSIFKQCESIIKKSSVYLPMYYATDVILCSDYLSGADSDYNGYIDIKNIKQNGN